MTTIDFIFEPLPDLTAYEYWRCRNCGDSLDQIQRLPIDMLRHWVCRFTPEDEQATEGAQWFQSQVENARVYQTWWNN